MNELLKFDALFFAAHPDDIELCCGGTFIKFIKSGKTAGIIDLSNGEMSTRGNKETRFAETTNSNKILKPSVRINLNISDANIQNNRDNQLKIITIIREYRPEIIFIPFYNDRHPDHIHASTLIKEAAFYSGVKKIKSDGNQEEWRPKKLIYYMQSSLFEPSFVIDITDTFEEKMEAIKSYKTQFTFDNLEGPKTFISDEKFLNYVESRAVFYGFQIGRKYGEPFFVDGKIELSLDNLLNISDLR